jgi:hypothetical protein
MHLRAIAASNQDDVAAGAGIGDFEHIRAGRQGDTGQLHAAAECEVRRATGVERRRRRGRRQYAEQNNTAQRVDDFSSKHSVLL